ncbi:MAG: DegT/DnrJ/EryC1/StrS family aminotransferase [Polyangiales bacterium]
MIQLADPAREHARYREEIESAALRVLRSGGYILGPEVAAFEQEFAAYCGAASAVGVSNGSDAIVVALQALGVGPGDEVITTAFSYFATASAILRTGATPVFADIDESFNLSPAEVAKKVSPRTRAILAVHLFGRAADTEALGEIARDRGLHLVEDAAQASGAERSGKRAGALGTVGCFSFFPAKPLGCDGDGGACVTNDPALAEAMKRVRVTGATAKNVHELPGGNYRLDPLQAGILRAKLPHYEARVARRRQNADALRSALAGASELLVLPADDAHGRHVYAQFTVRHPRRDALAAAMKARGVGAEVYYPMPMPSQKALASLGHGPGDFPAAERACAEVLSIPVHSELDDAEVARVCEVVREAAREVESR